MPEFGCYLLLTFNRYGTHCFTHSDKKKNEYFLMWIRWLVMANDKCVAVQRFVFSIFGAEFQENFAHQMQ